MDRSFLIVQIIYWLGLSTWFGGVLFITVATPIIFRTISDADPTLPTVLSVNLEGQHGTLLAGSIVANLIAGLRRIHAICAGVLLVAFVAQWVILFRLQWGPLILRSALYLVAALLLLYDWRVISPRIFKYREQYISHADEPEAATAAREQFDRYHTESVTLLMVELCALLGLVLFSAGISTAQSFALSR